MTYKKKHKKCNHSWRLLGRTLKETYTEVRYCPNCTRIWLSHVQGLLSLDEFKVYANKLNTQDNPILDFKYNKPVIINI